MNAAVIVKMTIALDPELYPNSSRLCSTLVGCIRLAGVYPRTLKLPRSECKSPLPLGPPGSLCHLIATISQEHYVRCMHTSSKAKLPVLLSLGGMHLHIWYKVCELCVLCSAVRLIQVEMK